ncbi:hypothetical protein BSKO_05878 [Bryopsis sp. KO-2023]|nr:hypothetical protein BSKO_05878 [Bryopsis sp. KO-2023]
MFFRLLIAFLLCALAFGREIINRDGGYLKISDDLDGIERQLLQMDSFEGTIVDANRFPYVVSIRQANGAHLCSGVLISEDLVVTAAKCWEFIFDYPLVYIGVQNSGVESVRQEVRLATKMIPELGSSLEQHSAPLGLIHLNATVNVRLPRLSSESANPSEKLELPGFGKDNATVFLFDEMRVETHVVQNQEICETNWGPSELVETGFCSLGENGLSSCIADSGSPVIRAGKIRGGDPSMDILVGIVTGGGICDYDKDKPETVAIDVFEHKEQLLKEIQMEEEEVGEEEEEKESWLKGHWWIFLLVGVAFVLGSGYLVKLNWKNWFPPSPPPEPWLLVEDSARTSEDSESVRLVSPFENAACMPEDTGGTSRPIISQSLRLTRLCPWRKIIGKGAFGIVEKGQFVDAAGVTHDVAVKTANIQTLGQDTESFRFVLESFRAEIECFERISSHPNIIHPNIIRCFGGRVGTPVDDSAMDFNEIFIVEELMDTNLRKIITGERTPWERWTYKTMLRIFRDIAKGLEHLHAHNVSHYDLKPENVLVRIVDEDFPLQIKLADFGCSDIKQGTYATAKNVGSMFYMAPEIRLYSYSPSRLVSGKIDVYSLGVVMWEILTGVNLMSKDAGMMPINQYPTDGSQSPANETSLIRKSEKRWPIADHHPLELSQLIWSCVELKSRKRPTTQMVLQTIERLMAAEWATDETVREAIVADKPSTEESQLIVRNAFLY